MTEITPANGHLQRLRVLQERLIQGVLRAMIPFGFLAVAAGSYDAYIQQEYWIIGLFALAYLSILPMALFPRAPYAAKVWVLIAILFIVGIADFFQDGRSGSARVFLLTIPFIAGVFSGKRASITAVIIVSLTTLIIGASFSFGWVAGPAEAVEFSGWVSGALVIAMLGALMVISLNYILPQLTSALLQSQELTGELEQQRAHLAEQVKEQTADLERHSRQLEIAAQINQEVSIIRDEQQVMSQVVRLVTERLGHYHAAIFLMNESGEHVVLKAASSEGGQRMLARGHRLQVGKVGIVGHVAGQGTARVAADVGSDAVYFDNPDMPYTRSETALPMRVRGEVIGVLDIQSRESDAFQPGDTTIFQTLADQTAITLSNIQLFKQVEESLELERRAYGELSRKGWRKLLYGRTDLRELYDPNNLLPANGEWRDEMKQAAQEGRVVVQHNNSIASLAIPLKANEQVIGVINAHKPAGTGQWTDEEISLMETLSEQLNVALESARLYQETQRRAERDRLITDISAQVRASTSVDTVLHTAIRELGRALRASGGQIQLETSKELDTLMPAE